jgi:hypothetical protein
MRLQPVLSLPRPRLSGIAVVARQDWTFSNTKFAAQLRCPELRHAQGRADQNFSSRRLCDRPPVAHFRNVSEEVVCTTMFVLRRFDGAKLLGFGPPAAAERAWWRTADLSYLASWLCFRCTRLSICFLDCRAKRHLVV